MIPEFIYLAPWLSYAKELIITTWTVNFPITHKALIDTVSRSTLKLTTLARSYCPLLLNIKDTSYGMIIEIYQKLTIFILQKKEDKVIVIYSIIYMKNNCMQINSQENPR